MNILPYHDKEFNDVDIFHDLGDEDHDMIHDPGPGMPQTKRRDHAPPFGNYSHYRLNR